MNKLVKLREVAEIVVSNVDKKYNSDEKEITLCNYTDVYKNWAITLENSKSFMLATAKEKEIEKFILRKGQVAITKDSEKKDDIGISAYISKNFNDTLLGYHCALITPNTEYLNGKFLNVFLHSKLAKKYFENQASGSGQRYSLSLESLNSLKIPLFNIGIQKKIGELYSNIDKKIELNNKINSELEAMAKTIYDYWFLQFEFPNEDGKPYKSSGGKMVWNDELKREIPEGWEVRKLEDIFSFEKGRIPKILYPVYQEGLIPYITIDVANNNKAQFCDLENMILCKEEVIMVMDGAASGDIYIGNTGAIGSTFSVLRIKRDDISNSLLYCLLNSLKGIYKKVNTGSTVPHANKKYIESMYIPLAKNMEKFSKIFENFYAQIIKNRKENQELASLRDFLLPLLMNGQVGFKEENN